MPWQSGPYDRRAFLQKGALGAAAIVPLAASASHALSGLETTRHVHPESGRDCGSVAETKMLVGARVGPDQTFAEVEAVLGDIRAGRVFYTGGDQTLPAAYDPHAVGCSPGVLTYVSFNVVDAKTGPYVRSCPSGLVRMIFRHEQELHYPTGADFVAAYTKAYRTMKAANPDIPVGITSSSYSYRTGGNARNGAYLPDPSIVDFYGIDLYQRVLSPAIGLDHYDHFQGWYQLVKDRGRPLAIIEYGRYLAPYPGSPDPAQEAERARIIGHDSRYLASIGGFQAWLYWYSWSNQNDHSKGTWRFTDTASSAAWRRVVATNRQRGRPADIRSSASLPVRAQHPLGGHE